MLADNARPGSSSVAEIVGAELKSVYGGSYGVQKLPYRRATETPQFDAAGNMTSDDLSTYIYDAEDRLVKITSAVGATASKEIRYDYQHRQVEEKDYAGTTLVKWRRFVWSGWMLLAEVNVDVGTQAKTVTQTFTWGPDLSGSVHGVAGIGGLLLVDKSSTQQYVAGDDGRGNVTVLLDALSTGTPSNNLKAGVEYGPYGEVVRSTGDLTLLPFRFQTKWALGQSWQGSLALEHLDFGRRVYVPTFGRFLNRDPIGEEGGANLYHYCGNDPINGIDPLGMEEQVNQPKKKPKDPRPPAGPQTGTRLPVTADEAGLTVRTLSPEALYGPGTGGSPGSGSYGVVLEFEGMPESPPPVVKREGNHSWLEPVIITGIRVILIWIPAHDPSLTISSSRGESPRNSRTARDQVSREETQSTQPQRGIPQTTGEQLFQGMRDTLAPAAPGAKLLESAVSFWATAWLTGPLLGVAAKGGPSLVHLTDNAGLAGINQSGAIVGKHGIFAVPRYVTAESTAMKVVRTGLSPLKTSEFVPIPQAAQGLFRQPMPIGPYSAWKYFGGVRYAPAGAISTATGAFTSAGSLLGPGTLIYGPDVLFYGGTCAAAWLCLEEGGNQ